VKTAVGGERRGNEKNFWGRAWHIKGKKNGRNWQPDDNQTLLKNTRKEGPITSQARLRGGKRTGTHVKKRKD